MVIDVEADCVRLPLHGEQVKVVGKALVGGKAVRSTDSARARISRPMDCAVNQRGLLADVLHDVDFAAAGPAGLFDVVAQHPERRPNALSARNFDARFESSIGLRKFAQGLQARGSVVSGDAVSSGIFLLQYFDDQVSILLVGVVESLRVVLKLVVAPASAAGFGDPFGGVDRGAVRAVELVAPD